AAAARSSLENAWMPRRMVGLDGSFPSQAYCEPAAMPSTGKSRRSAFPGWPGGLEGPADRGEAGNMDGIVSARVGIGGLLGLLLLLPGCSRQDADGVARLGRRLAERAETWSADLLGQVHIDLSSQSLESRVVNRLRWDKALAEQTITVRCNGAEIELHG